MIDAYYHKGSGVPTKQVYCEFANNHVQLNTYQVPRKHINNGI